MKARTKTVDIQAYEVATDLEKFLLHWLDRIEIYDDSDYYRNKDIVLEQVRLSLAHTTDIKREIMRGK